MTESGTDNVTRGSTSLTSCFSGWKMPFVCLTILTLLAFYWYQTRLPSHVTIAGGPSSGRYSELAYALAEELEHRLKIEVEVVDTQGSLENLQLLETHAADLALYQPETRLILEGHPKKNEGIQPASFVSNVYPEYLLPIGVGDHGRNFRPGEDRVWSCNDRLSGDYAATRLLLKHLGISEDEIDIKSVSYEHLPDALRSGTVDIGILCCGLDAPILLNLLDSPSTTFVNVPAVEALAQKNTSFTQGVVPAGFFQTSPPIPAHDFPTVTLQAQLLADNDASVKLIEEVTRILTDPAFQRRHRLSELLDNGADYATHRPEYEMHPGAQHVFFPELKPLLNPDFVEGTEGIRSFLVSFVAALWLLNRWWNHRQLRSQEHRLDRYIRNLLVLEQQQMEVDGEGGTEESTILQNLLDQVTILRQEALSEFTAHELNEDRAVDCFIHMCHALSDKVNAKLIRHTINQRWPGNAR